MYSTIGNNSEDVEYSCLSQNFTDLVYEECNLKLLYTYTITNFLDETLRLQRLIDENFNNIIYQSRLIESSSSISIDQVETFDICATRAGRRRAVVIADIAQESGGDGIHLPAISNELQFQSP